LVVYGGSQGRDFSTARAIVARMNAEGLPPGGFASVGSYRRVALDAAFLAGTRFNGHQDELGVDLTQLRRTGANYVVAGDPDPATRAILDKTGVRILPQIPLVLLYRLDKP
jgi:hypothetical protein